MTKTKIRFFVSYAHENQLVCDRFLKELTIQMRPSAKFEFELWNDRSILVGQDWKQEIEKAIDNSDIGLLLISPSFLGSQFIIAEELPNYLGNQSKPAIPVVIEKVNFERYNMHDLDKLQIFGHDPAKPYATCKGAQKTRFIEELYDQIEERLARLGF